MDIVTENQRKHTSNNPLQRYLIQKFHHKIFSLIEITNITHLLDVGCGEGFGINAVKTYNNNLRIMGLDNNLSALIWGKNHIIGHQPILCGNAIKLPFDNNAFPMIVCLEVLEHLNEPALYLKELIRVTSQFLIISVPHEPFFRIANFLRGKNISRLGNDIDHVNWFTVKKLKRLLSAQNIEIINHPLSFPWQIVLVKKV